MTAEPRDVEEIRGDLAATSRGGGFVTTLGGTKAETFRLARDVEPLLEALTAADRENAEMRAVIAATASDVERYVADRLADARQENAELRETLNRVADDRRAFCDERNAARAQLAAAQAQLAKHRDAMVAHMHRADAAEARLEAVWALHRANEGGSEDHGWCRECGKASPCPTLAALSPAPQPEPDVRAAYSESLRRLGRADLAPEPPAHADDCPGCAYCPEPPGSDEPARCEHDPRCSLNGAAAAGCHCVWHNGRHMACYPSCHAGGGCVEGFPGPAASGAPDGGS